MGETSDVLPLRRQSLRQMAEDRMKELIRLGRFVAGEKLPTEPVLAEKFGISRSTLREALATLAREGLVTRSPGGTVVTSARQVAQGLDRLVSFERLAEQQGLVCTSELLEMQLVEADTEVAMTLQVEPAEAVICVTELKLLGNAPGGLLEQFLSPRLITLDTLQRTFPGSLLELLYELPRPRLAYARATVRAIAAGTRGERLGLSPAEPVLRLDQTSYSEDERVLSYGRLFFRDDALQFTVTRRRL